jgi:hypothetical protein
MSASCPSWYPHHRAIVVRTLVKDPGRLSLIFVQSGSDCKQIDFLVLLPHQTQRHLRVVLCARQGELQIFSAWRFGQPVRLRGVRSRLVRGTTTEGVLQWHVVGFPALIYRYLLRLTHQLCKFPMNSHCHLHWKGCPLSFIRRCSCYSSAAGRTDISGQGPGLVVVLPRK